MTIVAIVGVVIGGCGLAHARCAWRAHDRLLLQLIALRIEHRREEIGWRRVTADHEAEVLAWREAAALQEAARRAMHDVVRQASPSRSPSTLTPPPVLGVGERHRRAMAAAGLSADEVQSTVRERRR